MKKIIILTFTTLLLSQNVSADSQSEHNNHQEIKRMYSKADAELNSLYRRQVQEYKTEGAGFYGQIESRDIYLIKSQLAWINFIST